MRSALKILANLKVIPQSRVNRQPTIATNRTQQRLRPIAGTRRKSKPERK